ncbi:uncharacterized protein LOC143257668 [Tachypleus tridentatus]|uniref:uncharacterized protein LOC143257668 n=1 Tax=Tachypleus tridentatus TaxID=6853 RepID=UPI003FD66871
MIIGSCVFCFGIAGTYWSIQHSLVTTIITYGVIDTLGFVCCFGHPVVTAVELFPNKKGFVTGPVASGFAVTPLFMNSVQTFLVNPNNLQPASDGYFYNDEIIESVPALFLIMASITGGILLIGLLMYEELPQELKQTYGQTFIGDDTFLSIVGSVAGAVHALSRVTVGLIQDKISHKYMMNSLGFTCVGVEGRR